MSAAIRIGCSGWQYRAWRGRFYPTDLPATRWLEFYAQHFDTVELNGSFYRLPAAATFRAWDRRLSTGFVMAVKASRYLTHTKRLKDPEEPLSRLWSRAEGLGPHLGPMLYQLPPRWAVNEERLATFLRAVPADRAQVVEFRDRSWYRPQVSSLLAAGDVALCLHDMPDSAPAPCPVGPFVYLRFHGAGGQRYGGRYDSGVLRAWGDRLRAWADDGLPSWVYFNNDIDGHAVEDATRLREIVAA